VDQSAEDNRCEASQVGLDGLEEVVMGLAG
jgi:hypothetical protein